MSNFEVDFFFRFFCWEDFCRPFPKSQQNPQKMGSRPTVLMVLINQLIGQKTYSQAVIMEFFHFYLNIHPNRWLHSLISEPSAKIRGWALRADARWILGRDERNRFLKLLVMENPGKNTSGYGKNLMISYYDLIGFFRRYQSQLIDSCLTFEANQPLKNSLQQFSRAVEKELSWTMPQSLI